MSDQHSAADRGELTGLLLLWAEGDAAALDRLTPMVYGELKRLAHHYLRDESREPILQTTALVHEAYMRLVGLDVTWQGRGHFVAVSARLMRRILVDRARRRAADKRGSNARVESLDAQVREVAESAAAPAVSDPILRLHEALEELSSFDARKHEVIELKYFGGATVAEISRVLEVAPRTVERDLRLGRAWLAESLGGGGVLA